MTVVHLDTWIRFCLTCKSCEIKAPAPMNKCKRTLCPETGFRYRSAADPSEKRTHKEALKTDLAETVAEMPLLLWICKSPSRGQCHGNELEQPTVHRRGESAQLLSSHTLTRMHVTMPLWTPGLWYKQQALMYILTLLFFLFSFLIQMDLI